MNNLNIDDSKYWFSKVIINNITSTRGAMLVSCMGINTRKHYTYVIPIHESNLINALEKLPNTLEGREVTFKIKRNTVGTNHYIVDIVGLCNMLNEDKVVVDEASPVKSHPQVSFLPENKLLYFSSTKIYFIHNNKLYLCEDFVCKYEPTNHCTVYTFYDSKVVHVDKKDIPKSLRNRIDWDIFEQLV